MYPSLLVKTKVQERSYDRDVSLRKGADGDASILPKILRAVVRF